MRYKEIPRKAGVKVESMGPRIWKKSKPPLVGAEVTLNAHIESGKGEGKVGPKWGPNVTGEAITKHSVKAWSGLTGGNRVEPTWRPELNP